jgi:hypothetical protein
VEECHTKQKNLANVVLTEFKSMYLMQKIIHLKYVCVSVYVTTNQNNKKRYNRKEIYAL